MFIVEPVKSSDVNVIVLYMCRFGSVITTEDNRMEQELVGTYGTSLDRNKMVSGFINSV